MSNNNTTCISLKNSNACTGFGDYSVAANSEFSDLIDFDNYIRAQSNPIQLLGTSGCNTDQVRTYATQLRYMNGYFCTQQIKNSWNDCNQQVGASRARSSSSSLQSNPSQASKRTRLVKRQNFSVVTTPMMCLSTCMEARDNLNSRFLMNSTTCPFTASNDELTQRQNILLNFSITCNGLVDSSNCLRGTNFESSMCGFPSLGDAQTYCDSFNDSKPKCCSSLGVTPTSTPAPSSDNDNGGLAVGWRVLIALLALLLVILLLVAILIYKRKRRQKKEGLYSAENVSRNGSKNSQITNHSTRNNSPTPSLKSGAYMDNGVYAAGKQSKNNEHTSKTISNSSDSVTTLSMIDSENGPDSTRQSDSAATARAKSGRFSSVVNPFVAALGGFFAGRSKSTSRKATELNTASNVGDGQGANEVQAYGAYPSGMTYSAYGGNDAQANGSATNMSSYAAVVSSTTTTTTTTTNGALPANVPLDADIVEAVHVYLPTLNDELHLEIGDKILVLKRFDDGWASGSKLSTGEEGAFPLICTRPWDVNATNITPANTNPTHSSTSSPPLPALPLDASKEEHVSSSPVKSVQGQSSPKSGGLTGSGQVATPDLK